MSGDSEQERQDTLDRFGAAVNMTADELEKWLDTDQSREVGQEDGGESTGHASGRRIVQLLRTRKGDINDNDLPHMRKVTGYVRRHLAQRPKGDALLPDELGVRPREIATPTGASASVRAVGPRVAAARRPPTRRGSRHGTRPFHEHRRAASSRPAVELRR